MRKILTRGLLRVQVVLTLTPPRRPVKPAPPDFVPGQAGVARLVTKTCSGSVATNAPTMIKQGDAQQQAAVAHAQFETIHPFTDGEQKEFYGYFRSLVQGGADNEAG